MDDDSHLIKLCCKYILNEVVSLLKTYILLPYHATKKTGS